MKLTLSNHFVKMGDATRETILRTLAFADAAEMPLTAHETHKFLIGGNSKFEYRPPKADPSRQTRLARLPVPPPVENPKFFDVMRTLDELVQERLLMEQWGYYAFADRPNLIEERLQRLQINSEKVKRAKRWARWIVRLPYIRGIFAYGSLATGNTKEDSDLDILVVTAPGRIFTARFLVTWFTELFGVRRTRSEIRDRICLNHYVTENALALPESYRNLPTAWLWARMFPLATRRTRLGTQFSQQNAWVGEWFLNLREMTLNFTQKDAKSFGVVSRKISRVFAMRPADVFEAVARNLQLRKISRNPLTRTTTGRIVANDSMLIFHPELPEERRTADFRHRLTRLGIEEPGLYELSAKKRAS